VIENYFNDYMLWVNRSKGAEEEKGLQCGYYEIEWAALLDIQPRFDLWDRVEQQVYGECLMRNDVPGMSEYLRRRERRLKLS